MRCPGNQARAAQRQVAVRIELRQLPRRRSEGFADEAVARRHWRRDEPASNSLASDSTGNRAHAGLCAAARQHRRKRSRQFPRHGSRRCRRAAGSNPNYLKYRSTGFNIFLDTDGYPAITPPWGTLNAIDLNKGEIRWKIPFGEYPKLAAQGLTNTGTDNYGGAIVTENGLLFIGATTYDNKFHVYDKLTGKLLWETTLPAAGNATPSIYIVNGARTSSSHAAAGRTMRRRAEHTWRFHSATNRTSSPTNE